MRTDRKFTYEAFNPDGRAVLHTEYAECRYPSKTEMSILDAGLTIKINGKRLTKKEVQNRT